MVGDPPPAAPSEKEEALTYQQSLLLKQQEYINKMQKNKEKNEEIQANTGLLPGG